MKIKLGDPEFIKMLEEAEKAFFDKVKRIGLFGVTEEDKKEKEESDKKFAPTSNDILHWERQWPEINDKHWCKYQGVEYSIRTWFDEVIMCELWIRADNVEHHIWRMPLTEAEQLCYNHATSTCKTLIVR